MDTAGSNTPPPLTAVHPTQLDRVRSCTNVPTIRAEGYTRNTSAHGSWDVVVTVCASCHTEVRAQIAAAGLMPYSRPPAPQGDDARCGDRVTYEPNAYTTKHEGHPR